MSGLPHPIGGRVHTFVVTAVVLPVKFSSARSMAGAFTVGFMLENEVTKDQSVGVIAAPEQEQHERAESENEPKRGSEEVVFHGKQRDVKRIAQVT